MDFLSDFVTLFLGKLQSPTLGFLIGGMVVAAVNSRLQIPDAIYKCIVFMLAWGPKLSIQGRASFSGSGVEEDRRVNQRVLNFPIAENPIFSLAIAKKPHSSCHKSTSSKACPAWHSA